jgi:hypothetical protein
LFFWGVQNWSGKKVLMNLTSKDEEIEKNYKRFEAFFSTLACLRFDDIIRINNETNLKNILFLLIDDIQSIIVEYRFTILLARKIKLHKELFGKYFLLVEAILRGLITTVAHGRRNKPGKISPFIGHKVLVWNGLLISYNRNCVSWATELVRSECKRKLDTW